MTVSSWERSPPPPPKASQMAGPNIHPNKANPQTPHPTLHAFAFLLLFLACGAVVEDWSVGLDAVEDAAVGEVEVRCRSPAAAVVDDMERICFGGKFGVNSL
jgi:hypothetical protein